MSLASEARILLNSGKEERAYYLSHMATEEASKSIILKFIDLFGTSSDQMERVTKLLRNHKKKIEFILSLSKSENPELTKQLEGYEKDLVAHINDLKNNSMYVTYINGAISTPSESIAEKDVTKFIEFAESMAKYSSIKLTSKSKGLVNSPLT